MPKCFARRKQSVGFQGNRVQAIYEKDKSGDPAKRSQEAQDIIARMILLSHKRGRVKKEREEERYVA
jgi:hypothetical protein